MMIKRLLLVAVLSFVVGQFAVLGVRTLQARGFIGNQEAARKADQVRDVMRLIHDHYVEPIPSGYDSLTESALDGMISSLDPHSEYLSRRKFETLREETSQKFGGIGVQVEMRERILTVVTPIPGTPGEKAGLLRGDKIIRVDDRSTERLSMSDCIALLRGKPRTRVDLTIFRPATEETFSVTIVRQVIEVENVRHPRMLDDRIGYIRILQFGERTPDEFLAALESLESQGMQALILDVRNNPGGLLDSAIGVAEPFFSRGEQIVYTQGRDPASRKDIVARSRAQARDLPIAVLINSGSASAAEIVAGALRDTHRAVLIGERTFGKGSVQTIMPLRNGEALRLTTAFYYTPGGAVIDGEGVPPHIELALSFDEERKLFIQNSRLGVMSEVDFVQDFGFEPIPDRQLLAAIDALEAMLFTLEGREREDHAAIRTPVH
ncbi:MAG: S41 family peptidase [Puniceicoccaceae bacterium]|nr:MAG: S41 family peptidase [Puniceicoccaceae bacterium]